MNYPITWGDYITVRLMIASGVLVLCVVLGVVLVIANYWKDWKDIHANDEKPSKEPYAGKTLGL